MGEQETNLQNLRRQVERVRERVDVGTANPAELERLKNELRSPNCGCTWREKTTMRA